MSVSWDVLSGAHSNDKVDVENGNHVEMMLVDAENMLGQGGGWGGWGGWLTHPNRDKFFRAAPHTR